jgi:hypothetical protein
VCILVVLLCIRSTHLVLLLFFIPDLRCHLLVNFSHFIIYQEWLWWLLRALVLVVMAIVVFQCVMWAIPSSSGSSGSGSGGSSGGLNKYHRY